MSKRVTDRLVPMVESAITLVSHGDDVTYDLTFVQMPNGAAAIFLGVFMPGIVLGTDISAAVVIPNPSGITEESILDVIPRLVEAMRLERSKQAQIGNGDPRLVIPGA